MKRLVLLAVAAAALVAPAAASAHPLGNFTINRFSRVEVSGHRLYVRYVLDMAEIPTYQAGHIDRRAYARRIAGNTRLQVDGRQVRLVPLGTALAHPRGAAGLYTTRLEVILAGPTLGGKTSIAYRDENYRDRIGWSEIVVGAQTHSISDELRAYPKNMLQSPLDVTWARTTLSPTSGPDVPPALSSGKTLEALNPGKQFDKPGETIMAPNVASTAAPHASKLVVDGSTGSVSVVAGDTVALGVTQSNSSPTVTSFVSVRCQ